MKSSTILKPQRYPSPPLLKKTLLRYTLALGRQLLRQDELQHLELSIMVLDFELLL